MPTAPWIVALPAATAVAKPDAVMLATAVLVELQVAEPVRSWLLPSLNIPVAVNCCVAPGLMFAFAGVMEMDTKAGAVTVRVVDPATEPELACIVVLPAVTPLANPALVIVATAVVLEFQMTEAVRFCELPSL